MGVNADGFVHAVTEIARRFDPALRRRDDRAAGRAAARTTCGVTITITATSREQLDELYRTLSTHPMVKVVL